MMKYFSILKAKKIGKSSSPNLRNAINNLNRLLNLKIGDGGFGSVYKCSLHSQAPPPVVKKLDGNDLQKTYIVRLESPDGIQFDKQEDRLSWYNSFLVASSDGSNVKPSIIHAYDIVLTGFAAKLSADQVKKMEGMDGFVSATPERMYKLHTTHTPTKT